MLLNTLVTNKRLFTLKRLCALKSKADYAQKEDIYLPIYFVMFSKSSEMKRSFDSMISEFWLQIKEMPEKVWIDQIKYEFKWIPGEQTCKLN